MVCDFDRLHNDVLSIGDWLGKAADNGVPPDVLSGLQDKFNLLLTSKFLSGATPGIISPQEIDSLKGVSSAADKVLTRIDHEVTMLGKPMNELEHITEPIVKIKYYIEDAVRLAKGCSGFEVPIEYRGFI